MKKKPFISPDRPDLFSKLYNQGKVNCALIMDEHGHVMHINDAFKNAYGYSEKDIIGKHTRILFTEQDQKSLRPEMELIIVKKQGFATDQNFTMHRNGQPIWSSGESVWVESKEHGNCIVKVIQNIHAQKLQEKFLTEAHEFSQTIFESIDDALLVVNNDLRILKANASFYQMLDLTPASLEGNYLADTDVLKLDLEIQKKIVSLATTPSHEVIELNIPGGNKRVLKLSSKALDDHPGHERRILLLFQDITAEKETEQQREDVINFVSHELRNPMANLALVLELLPEAVKSNNMQETDDYLEKAKVNLRRLKQVIGELHDATRAGTGHLNIQKASFNLQGMIREAIDTVRLLYPTHQIIPPAEADISIHADRFRLIQVLNNYLTNAIKYSPNADKVILQVRRENEKVIISVTDQGPGISAEQLPYVFNKYYRGQSNVKIEGLGLGLYVCKEIINAHGGDVWVTSQPGTGSTFFFSIPA